MYGLQFTAFSRNSQQIDVTVGAGMILTIARQVGCKEWLRAFCLTFDDQPLRSTQENSSSRCNGQAARTSMA